MSRGGITSCGRFLISLVMSKISSECLVGDHRLTNRKGDEDDDGDDGDDYGDGGNDEDL